MKTRVILFNKPCGVLCQFRPSAARRTLADFIDAPGVYAAGRLDAASEGLLVLTDDGSLQHRITDPRRKLEKVYWAEVEQRPAREALDRLRRGIEIGGRCLGPRLLILAVAPEKLPGPGVPGQRVRVIVGGVTAPVPFIAGLARFDQGAWMDKPACERSSTFPLMCWHFSAQGHHRMWHICSRAFTTYFVAGRMMGSGLPPQRKTYVVALRTFITRAGRKHAIHVPFRLRTLG